MPEKKIDQEQQEMLLQTPEEKEVEKLPEGMSERKLAQQEKSMKKILLSAKKVPIIIPDDPLNPNDGYTISVNGVVMVVPRGVQIEIPEPFALVAMDSLARTKAAMAKLHRKKQQEVQIL